MYSVCWGVCVQMSRGTIEWRMGEHNWLGCGTAGDSGARDTQLMTYPAETPAQPHWHLVLPGMFVRSCRPVC